MNRSLGLFPLPLGGEDGEFNRQLLSLLLRLLFSAADSDREEVDSHQHGTCVRGKLP